MSAGALALGMSSCENGDISFPDSDAGITVYFPYQYPVRTITLGEIATYDNSRENNEHKFTIYSTMGGSYSGKDINVNFTVDESLLEGLTFDGTNPVKALPSNYYQLSGSTLSYNGTFRGGVDVQLSDEFFNDPASVKNTYVIPLLMTGVSGADARILSEGTPIPEKVGQNPARTDVESWNKSPMDFTLFCVNFINKYDGNYLRRGTDEIVRDGKKRTNGFIKIETGNQTGWAWDNQFFLTFPDNVIQEGDKWEYSMKVRAEKPASVGTQVHRAPGGYLHWSAIGNIDFTTEWKEISNSGTFTAAGSSPAGGYTIAFNLNIGQNDKDDQGNDIPTPHEDANTFYFDEISLKINGEEVIVNGDCEGTGTSSFISSVNIGENAGNQVPSTFDGTFEDIKGTSTVTREHEFIESDEVIKATTKTLNSVTLPVKVETADGTPVTCHLLLTFDGSDKCTISVDSDSESAAKGYTATGTGEFKSKSEKLAWGNKDRDGLYLNYTIDLGDCTFTTQDVLVARDRGTAGSIQTFKPVYTKQ